MNTRAEIVITIMAAIGRTINSMPPRSHEFERVLKALKGVLAKNKPREFRAPGTTPTDSEKIQKRPIFGY